MGRPKSSGLNQRRRDRHPRADWINLRIRQLSDPGDSAGNLSVVEFSEEWSLIYNNMLMFELDKKSPAWKHRVKDLSCGERDKTLTGCGHTSAQAVVTCIDGEW
jgi:hypothetical protein